MEFTKEQFLEQFTISDIDYETFVCKLGYKLKAGNKLFAEVISKWEFDDERYEMLQNALTHELRTEIDDAVKNEEFVFPAPTPDYSSIPETFTKDELDKYLFTVLHRFLVVNGKDVLELWYDKHISTNTKSKKRHEFLDFSAMVNALGKEDPSMVTIANKEVEDFAGNKTIENEKPTLPLNTDIVQGSYKSTYARVQKNLFFADIYSTDKVLGSDTMYDTLQSFFSDLVISTKLTTPSTLACLLRGDLDTVFAVFRGTTSRASVFNPVTFAWVLNTYFKGSSVLTPVLDWDSYVHGFFNTANNWKEYVGIDVIPQVVDHGRELATEMQDVITKRLQNVAAFEGKTEEELADVKCAKEATLFCCPSEQLDARHDFSERYKDHFDAIFFSPPYFQLELYEGGEQSIESFDTFDEWIAGYWIPTVELCYRVMKPGGRMGIIVSNYKDREGKMVKISEAFCDNAIEAGFELVHHHRLAWGVFKVLKVEKQKDGNLENFFILEKPLV